MLDWEKQTNLKGKVTSFLLPPCLSCRVKRQAITYRINIAETITNSPQVVVICLTKGI